MTEIPLDVSSFEALPSRLVLHLRADLDRMAADLLRELEGGVPSERLRERVMSGLAHFADLVEEPRGAWSRLAPWYQDLGRRLAREGRGPEEVHQGLRQTGRAVWRSVKGVLETLDIDRATIGRLAEAQFSYMDAVAAAVRQGYEAEGEATPEVLERRRAALLSRLLALEPGDSAEAAIAEAAGRARWPVPATAAVAVLAPRDPRHQPARPLSGGVLVDWGRARPRVLLPDPDGPGGARLLEPLLRDWIVVVGLTVPVRAAADSHRWAQQTLLLVERGVVPRDGLVRCADHVPTLVMFGAENLLDTMAPTRLAPLEGLPPVQRERLTETLLSLLAHNFNATEAGRRMHVHPQTVRYRFRQLEKLFGADLADPQRCLEIEMILRTRRPGAPGRRPALSGGAAATTPRPDSGP
ncbi:helix-turn-helix domain-containing protein [Actinocorallia populi]|uniref:PucR family transcriptional regulator n=1 Tax=Actinocorallia populi TaxID=2079200 RepID=UPI000D08B781|nr:helix-turn-helix domain-containing protein [Actinocorallia populi]